MPIEQIIQSGQWPASNQQAKTTNNSIFNLQTFYIGEKSSRYQFSVHFTLATILAINEFSTTSIVIVIMEHNMRQIHNYIGPRAFLFTSIIRTRERPGPKIAKTQKIKQQRLQYTNQQTTTNEQFGRGDDTFSSAEQLLFGQLGQSN